jgi:hypothetical protein
MCMGRMSSRRQQSLNHASGCSLCLISVAEFFISTECIVSWSDSTAVRGHSFSGVKGLVRFRVYLVVCAEVSCSRPRTRASSTVVVTADLE